jgi:hypothetical protein
MFLPLEPLSGTRATLTMLAQAPAFPPEVKTVMDGMPAAIQVAVSLAFFFLTIVSALGMVKWARRTEPKSISNDVVLPGLNASIMDMNPVRDLVKAVDRLAAAMERSTHDAAKNASAMEAYVARQLEEDNFDRRARSLFEQWLREHEGRTSRRPRT